MAPNVSLSRETMVGIFGPIHFMISFCFRSIVLKFSCVTDWFDGLQTFMRYICHKSWLGGWLMPQKKSYFALQLPKGWWVFGLDLALHCDIDVYQFKFFAALIKEKVNPFVLLIFKYIQQSACVISRVLGCALSN